MKFELSGFGKGDRFLVDELLNRLDVLSREELLDRLSEALKFSDDVGPTTVSFLNSHAVNLAVSNEEFNAALHSSTYLLRDGVGIQLALMCKRKPAGENLNGTDLIPSILDYFCGRAVALLGSTDEILEKAIDVLRTEYGSNVVLSKNGFDYESEDYLHYLSLERPEIVILAMGMPKQEILQHYLKNHWKITRPTIVISGGAILSFLSGYEKRAPRLFLRLKIEWFWRFLHDPRRLFNRYFIGGFQFVRVLLRSCFTKQ